MGKCSKIGTLKTITDFFAQRAHNKEFLCNDQIAVLENPVEEGAPEAEPTNGG